MSNNGPKAIVPGGRGAKDSDNIPNNSAGNSKSKPSTHDNLKSSIYGDNQASKDAAPSAEDAADVKSGA
jgi:hypothetical protein